MTRRTFILSTIGTALAACVPTVPTQNRAVVKSILQMQRELDQTGREHIDTIRQMIAEVEGLRRVSHDDRQLIVRAIRIRWPTNEELKGK